MNDNDFGTKRFFADQEAIRGYVKQGVVAISAVHSGALLSSLANFDALRCASPADASVAFTLWSVGLSLAVCLWLVAYFSAACYANDRQKCGEWISILGLVMAIGSISLFLSGCFRVAQALKSTGVC